ncbi:hypothetical protein OSTOST_06610 [Ostertagia ostertagi]
MTSAYAEWNQRQDRIVIPFSTRVNLDDLFGNVHTNVVCERITPCKLALYVLIQVLDEIHQDVQAFTQSEHCSLLATLYGMIEHGDMSYLELSSEWNQLSTQQVFECNARFIEWIRDGDDHVDDIQRMDDAEPTRVNLDDLFGNVHTNVVCERITPCKLALYVLIQVLDEIHQDVQAFTQSEHCSLLATLYGMIEHGDMSYLEVGRVVRWMDRTIRKGIYQDFIEYFEIFNVGNQSTVIPFEIESSGRARKWIANQMHLLQVCPSAALPDNEIMDWCQIIRKNHVDIVQVHLLEMLCHIRAMNLGRAAESLRIYFDYSMFR